MVRLRIKHIKMCQLIECSPAAALLSTSFFWCCEYVHGSVWPHDDPPSSMVCFLSDYYSPPWSAMAATDSETTKEMTAEKLDT